MKFIFLKDENIWFELDYDKMRCYNFHSGHFDIDENSDWYIDGIVKDFDSWHHLYKETGFNPLKSDTLYHDCWVDKLGNNYNGTAHAIVAEDICEILFGEDVISNPEDLLISNGWIKLTTSMMLEIYEEDGKYNWLTKQQIDFIRRWASAYRLNVRIHNRRAYFSRIRD